MSGNQTTLNIGTKAATSEVRGFFASLFLARLAIGQLLRTFSAYQPVLLKGRVLRPGS
jgi:hypothetical protein